MILRTTLFVGAMLSSSAALIAQTALRAEITPTVGSKSTSFVEKKYTPVGPSIPTDWDWTKGYVAVAAPQKVETVRAVQSQLAIHNALSELEMEPSMQSASWSFCALDLATGKVIAQRDMMHPLIPASSMKTLTTSTALSLFGNDFTFKTELGYDGTILDGVLTGNLYIKSYGDPLLCSASPEAGMSYESFAQMLARVVRDMGIRSINGYIVGDDMVLPQNVMAAWQPYSANISQYVATTPAPVTESFSDEGGDSFGQTSKVVTSVAISSNDPVLQLAFTLRNVLNKYGITVSQPVVTQRALLATNNASILPRQNVFTHNSAPLRYIVKRTNEKSSNVFAEAILRAVGFYSTGAGSTYNGASEVRRHWAAKGLDMSSSAIYDGSGLSYGNNVSAHTFARLMEMIHKDKTIQSSFYESLPIAGATGTLEKWFYGMSGAGRIHAKTGTLTRVLSYTGYAPMADGRMAAFSLIVNNYSGTPYAMRLKLTQALSRLVE
jgi:serine-type D-Ala-D-Ala carboxypeptidase/endopeptidase (penicillin-binding protein 4)